MYIVAVANMSHMSLRFQILREFVYEILLTGEQRCITGNASIAGAVDDFLIMTSLLDSS